MPTLTSKNAALALAAFALVGTVSGCSAASDAATSDSGTGTTTDSGSSDTTTTSGDYADGTYDATGSYQSPNGNETIEVELTLADNVITAVTVTGDGTSPDSKRYQGEFIAGISAVVVGKDIDDIQVDKVAGSSLTSGGFNDAVEQIKTEAAA